MERLVKFHLDTVPSTMDAARELLTDIPFGLVTANRQTRGRGTQGRVWLSPVGNLYMTLGISLRYLPPARLQTMALEAGMALFDALVPGLEKSVASRLWLKWPNDLLVEEEKVAGLLLEATATHLLVGLGINLSVGPALDDGGRPAGRLFPTASPSLDKEGVAEAFVKSLESRLEIPWSEEEKESLIRQWSARSRWDKPLPLRGEAPAGVVWPIALDKEGYLRIRRENGEETTLVAEYPW